MSYIKDENHFINFINKICRDNKFTSEEIYSNEWYLKNFYILNRCDVFTWKIKEKPNLIKKNNIENYLTNLIESEKELDFYKQNIQTNKNLNSKRKISHNNLLFEDKQKFNVYTENLKFPGVYFLCKGDYDFHNIKIIYIGSSKNLSNRIMYSFFEKLHLLKQEDVYKIYFIKTKTEIDARILELYYIGLNKPELNSFGITNEDINVTVMYPQIEIINLLSVKLEWDIKSCSSETISLKPNIKL